MFIVIYAIELIAKYLPFVNKTWTNDNSENNFEN